MTMTADLLRKVPPQNIEAEVGVLAGVLLKNSLFHDISEELSEEDFYSPAHSIIFAAFVSLYSKSIPIDLVTVAEELDKMDKLEQVGGRAYLAELSGAVVSASNATYYASIVKDRSTQRQLIDVASDIIKNSFEKGEKVADLIDTSENAIFQISEQRATNKISSAKEMVEQVFKDLETKAASHDLITGVNTGYTRLNEMTAGFQPTDLIIIAARPAMGKTAFVLNLALNAATDVTSPTPTVVFSLEMGKEQLMTRLLCVQGDVDMGKMRRSNLLDDDDWAKLYDAAQVLEKAPIFIDDTPALGILELRARCRRLKKDKGLGMIIVDYLQLMRGSRQIDSREQEISDISRNLKALAKELHVPVIALSQLNRKVEERSNRRPMMSDLRESGAIEQDADMIMFIYRDEVYNKESPKKGIAEIIIGKQRNGATGDCELAWMGRSTRFGDLAYMPDLSDYGRAV